MKILISWAFTGKSNFQRVGASGDAKNQYIAGRELPKGRWVGTWTVCKFKRGLGEKEGVVFFRGRGQYPNAHYG